MSQGTLSRRLRFVPWLILAAGIVLTVVLEERERTAAWQSLQAEFDFRTKGVLTDISQRLSRYEQVLDGTAGLFLASRTVSRKAFSDYVGAQKLETKYPGIQGVGFAKLVMPADKPREIAAVRAEGFPDFEIWPAGTREFYTAVVYLEPFNWRNRRAFGYDMYSETIRRSAMERARDADLSIISGKIRLVQETTDQVQHGFLMFLPVYRSHASHQTVSERRANLVGWVYAPFRMNDLMQGILQEHYGEISATLDLHIYDGDLPEDQALMFDSNVLVNRPHSAFQAVTPIPLFGHRWTAVIMSLPEFEGRLRTDKAHMIAVAGASGSILLSLVVWLLVTGRGRAIALAETMTEELRQSESVQRRLNRALRLLSDCGAVLVRTNEEHGFVAEICRLCVERGDYLMAWVGYAESDEKKHVRPVAQAGYEKGYLDGISISWADSERGRGPTGTAIRSGRTSVNQNILTNPSMAPWRQEAIRRGYQSSVALPLIHDTKVLGALNIYAREANAFNREEVELLEELAGELAYGIVSLRTRAEHDAAKEKVAFLANFDPVTRLPNRLLLRDRFEIAALIGRSEQTKVALLYLDIDHFKPINDSLGPGGGDKVLLAVVERLRLYVPATDTISRVGGDEFVVLLGGIRESAAAAHVAGAVVDAFAEPLNVDRQLLNVAFSIGISVYADDGDNFDTLLERAETAMNSTKEAGGNMYRFFTREMNVDVTEQIRLTGAMLKALREREFVLHYQPQVDIRSGKLVGAEALIRWQHPLDGLISPAKFIPLAEQSGHIVPIGQWVLDEACRQGKAWIDAGLDSFVIAVNLSALQFQRGNVLEMVEQTLRAHALPADRLELELTESVLLQDAQATLETLRRLKAMGVRIAIDDFGTGYSSLAYLKQLAVDKLKISYSFVRDMIADAEGAAIVKAIIQLGHNLQLRVIAEGVEEDVQLQLLRGYECDEIQGYLFSRPLPADQFVAFVSGKAKTFGSN